MSVSTNPVIVDVEKEKKYVHGAGLQPQAFPVKVSYCHMAKLLTKHVFLSKCLPVMKGQAVL